MGPEVAHVKHAGGAWRMDEQETNGIGVNPLRTQLMVMRLSLLFIPLYLFLLSPTCGIFGPDLWKISSVLRIAFIGVIPGILFSFLGVLANSNAATAISGAWMTFIIMLNTVAGAFLTIFDFTLLLFFLEFSSTLNSFSGIVKTIKVGNDENVSYNYRVLVNAYVRRVFAVILATFAISVAAVFMALGLETQIGGSGITVVSVLALILAFGVIWTRYRKR